jgi:paired amphipathic helix protein Sin3a
MNSQSHLSGGGAVSGGPPRDRDREMDDRHRAMQQDEIARHDQDRERERERDRDRDAGDRYQPAPHHSSTGTIPIHQPVASRIAGAIHSPGGLLANDNASAPPQSHLGGGGHSTAPMANFGGPLQGEHNRQGQQHGAGGPGAGPAGGNSQHQMYGMMPQHGQGGPGGAQPANSRMGSSYISPMRDQPQPQQHPIQQQPPAHPQEHPPPLPQQQDAQRGAQAQQNAPFLGPAGAAQQLPGAITHGQQPILNVSDKVF